MMDQIRFLNDDVLRNSMKYFRYLSFLHKVK
ncbi:unknown [Porphyromonas sp. CAG:1061]|nr:unknown [Porphyromonas sp. CAG:1061]